MTREHFRTLVEQMLHQKPQWVKDEVKKDIQDILDITKKATLSEETVALIIHYTEKFKSPVNT